MKKNKIIIVGAGLSGTLLAIRMAQRGIEVSLHEKRSDMRKDAWEGGRSINLALSERGLIALDRVGLKEEVLKECIPMKGRMIHSETGELRFSPYSGREEDFINSVSRSGLNITLLDEAEKMDNLTLHFHSSCQKVELENGAIHVKNMQSGEVRREEADLVIGTDGAGSAVRSSMMARTPELLFNFSQDFLRHGYKELSIHPGDGGAFKIEKNALHIWPRHEFMMIALPNLDGSFTLTMFHPYKGKAGFDELTTREKVKAFFEEAYADLLPFIPHYLDEYFENPVGILGTIRCLPWQAFGKTLIMGDAAHAIVPFYGQGMNASFEDVRVFDDLMQEMGDDWDKILPEFERRRHANANAIADLALDNFMEMQDKVADEAFILKRKIEMELEQTYPDYYSKYSLVTFRPELPYAQAMKLGRLQDKHLLDICKNGSIHQMNLEEVHHQMIGLQDVIEMA
ncbi:MAG: FAD-dependent monooxygenase [Bacteroidia bacterium]|nr:FAD-dependent monooxygenase [Bacteroidia bacterium]